MANFVDIDKLALQLNLSPQEKAKLIPPDETTQLLSDDYTGLVMDENRVKLYHDDFLTSQHIQENSIDLLVTSPPYNVGIEYNTHDDTHEYAQYLKFSRDWLQKAFDVMRDDGRMCLNIPLDKNKGGQQSVGADLTILAKEIGWQYHSTIIWNEGNISRRTAWGSWMSASAPYVIAPVELILVLYKKHWKKTKRKTPENDITRDEFMAWTNGVWTFNGESKKRIGHPAPFPRELPRRCAKLFSFVGDTVLDPFAGSGTTLLESWNNNRHSIGFDVSIEYCELAEKRLRTLWQSPKLI